MQQRLLSEEETTQAQEMIGWTFWFGPITQTVIFLVITWIVRGEALVPKLAIGGLLGGSALIFWILRFRAYATIQEDLGTGMARVMEGAPERAWISRGGLCYIRMQGIPIRVPNDEYKQIREANLVRVAYLPKSRIAVHVEVASGIGLISAAS